MAKLCRKCGTMIKTEAAFCPYCGEEVFGRQPGTPPAPVQTEPTTPPVTREVPTPVPTPYTPPTPTIPNGSSKKEKKHLTVSEKVAKKHQAKENKPDKPSKKKGKTAAVLILYLALVFLLSFATLAILNQFDVIDVPFMDRLFHSDSNSGTDDINLEDEDDSIPEEYTVVAPDAQQYFQDNSTILSVQDATASPQVHTESETYQNLTQRGFVDQPIVSEYNMAGEYAEPVTIDAASSSKHPSYMTYYVCANGQVWTIFEINGVVMANPVSYNLQSTRSAQLIISESESVTSYDGTTNKFYETIPSESELIVKTVSKIDAQTLENLDYGAIDAL